MIYRPVTGGDLGFARTRHFDETMGEIQHHIKQKKNAKIILGDGEIG
jgi:hypothetical protein